ncbi:MAG TPA: adenylate/guanylate cyclase domain-containing protein [Verrucomicrobiae bacterium]|nr:adenylate/guanylate cyclase domain-containing protein [Verrucomicrobiae bacterium]
MARALHRLRSSPKLVSLIIGVLACIAVLTARKLGGFQWLELRVYDMFLRWRWSAAAEDPHIVLIEITEDDISNPRLGDWPVWDADLARTLTILEQQQPCAIGIDMFRNLPVPKNGSQLSQLNSVLLSNHNIICIWTSGDAHHHGIPPPPVLEPYPDRLGITSFTPDYQIDKIVRRGVLFMDDGTNTFRSLALQLALSYLGSNGIQMEPVPSNPECFRLGKAIFRPFESNDGAYVNADARGYQMLLDFKGPKRFQTYTLTQTLSGQIPPGTLRNKIILLGDTAESKMDYFVTPMEYQHRGLVVHALMLNQLLREALDGDQPLRVWTEWKEVGWILIWCLSGTAIGFWVRSPWKFVLLAGACLLALGGGAWWGFQWGWWILTAAPATAFLLSAILVVSYASYYEKMQQGVVMSLFSKHVSREVAEAIWAQRDAFLEGGKLRAREVIATVLFTDLKGYAALAEQLGPSGVMEWLNEYMNATTRAVIDNGGVVHKYFGDSIMAVFGVPLTRTTEQEIKQDAIHAVRCALAMETAQLRLNKQWGDKGLPMCRMRVGIYTGPLMVGSLGSADRMEYAVVGDTVNIASRLEGFDKDTPDTEPDGAFCRILIGESTHKLLGDEFRTVRVGISPLKGKAERVTIYRVLSVAVPQEQALHER